MSGPDSAFWQTRFLEGRTPWDRGEASPQLHRWLSDGSLANLGRQAQIVVPGCGSGHEVLALAQAGWRVTAIDYAPAAIASAQARWAQAQAQAASSTQSPEAPPQPVIEWVQADVLQWAPSQPLDAVYEQTCLCALHPDHWVAYAQALHRWLRPGGLLLALFMQARSPGADQGFIEGPPYHIDSHAARALFPQTHWHWPKPPYAAVPHPIGRFELAVILTRR
jgi:SAM-dependent methyltransferase